MQVLFKSDANPATILRSYAQQSYGIENEIIYKKMQNEWSNLTLDDFYNEFEKNQSGFQNALDKYFNIENYRSFIKYLYSPQIKKEFATGTFVKQVLNNSQQSTDNKKEKKEEESLKEDPIKVFGETVRNIELDNEKTFLETFGEKLQGNEILSKLVQSLGNKEVNKNIDIKTVIVGMQFSVEARKKSKKARGKNIILETDKPESNKKASNYFNFPKDVAESFLTKFVSTYITIYNKNVKSDNEKLEQIRSLENKFLLGLREEESKVPTRDLITLESVKQFLGKFPKVYFTQIYNFLDTQDKDAAQSFKRWWEEKGQSAFTTLLINNTSRIRSILEPIVEQQWGKYNLQKKKDKSDYVKDRIDEIPDLFVTILKESGDNNLIGLLGETMFSILLESVTNDNTKLVLLGKTNFGTKDAATDVLLIEQGLNKLGFQIKNFPSAIGKGFSLYAQDWQLNAFSNKNKPSLRRYFSTEDVDFLSKTFVPHIFLKDHENEDKKNIYSNAIYFKQEVDIKNILEKTEILLFKRLPFIMRYSEQQIYEMTDFVNNFFILNFQFIPSSILFYGMSKLVEEEVKSQWNFFFFSGEKIKKEMSLSESNENLYSSFKSLNQKITWRNIYQQLENEIEKWYLNFSGFYVDFKDNKFIFMK